jgi:hypothetical protein
LDEIRFDCADRVEIVGEGFYVLLVGGEVFAWHHYDLAGEAVAESVLRRFLFAGFGPGSGGVLGVGPIDSGSRSH